MSEAGWYRSMTRPQRRTFLACFAGWALDGLDFQLYPLIIPVLIAEWHIGKEQAGQIATVTLLLSSLGGWLAGQLADRIGRVRTLQLTILWFSLFTALSGLTQNVEQLFVTRSLMGLGFGGEWTAGAVLIGEAVAARYRGRAVGIVQSAWSIGWGVAVLSSTLTQHYLPQDMAWRVLFLLGIAPALLVFFIRRNVEEPEIFRAKAEHRIAPMAIFTAAMLRTTLPAALVMTGMQGGYHAIVTWLPTYLKQSLGLNIFGSGQYLAVVIAGSFLGYVTGAFVTDLLGRKRHIVIYSLACLATVTGYTHLPIDNDAMLVLGFPLGFFSSGIFSSAGAFLSELFPTAIRGAGQGFCYNFGRGAGALIPWLIGRLSESHGLGAAIGLFAAGSYALVFVAVAFLPETKGRELT
jgi:MFS family permease